MASGWSNDNAVNEQIDATVEDGIRRAQARLAAAGPGSARCDECEREIPAARRAAVPGARLCVACQEEADRAEAIFTGYNRRGSKDSQLR
jgi:phage/conjugal plasmid C-4 type zinc finger TraR family protein